MDKPKPRWPKLIEVDAVNKQRLNLSKEELEQQKKNKLCFKYKKEGYKALFH
jgi:hypothetical protein